MAPVTSPLSGPLDLTCLPKIRRSQPPVYSVYIQCFSQQTVYIYNNMINTAALSIPPNGGNILAWLRVWAEGAKAQVDPIH